MAGDLGSHVESEIKKTRPCVIISPPEMYDYLRTVIVAPMITGSKAAPYQIPLRFGGKNDLILLDQLRTLDKSRLAGRLGAIGPKTLQATLDALRQMFAN